MYAILLMGASDSTIVFFYYVLEIGLIILTKQVQIFIEQH